MNICDKCVYVNSLKEWINSFSLKGICEVCKSENQSIIGWNSFLNHINRLIGQLYIENSKSNFVIRDILNYMEFKAHTEIKTKLIKQLSNTYSRRIDADIESTPSKIFPLIVLWEDFKNILKYKCRFFCKEYITENYHKPEKVEMFFNKFKNLIDEFREECLTSTLDENSLLYRARDNNKGQIATNNCHTLGPPPPEKKTHPTRTSPVGIPFFYSSTDKYTAIEEIKTTSQKFIVGQWRLNQRCFFIDISKYDDSYILPDYWSVKNLRKRDFIQLLSILNEDFSRKIEKDNKQHIEYLPTQIIAEYFKINYFDICGIIYRSSVSNKKNVAIFSERLQFSDKNKYSYLTNKDKKTLILEKFYIED